MKLSRKRRRELRHLRSQAQDLLDQQRVVLAQAGDVMHAASRQAKHLNREVVAPRVDVAMESVRPVVDRGVFAARRAAAQVRSVTAPVVSSALGAAVRTLEQVESGQAARQLRSFGEQRGLIAPVRKRRGAGRVIAAGLGIAAAAGVAYVVWQAFRSDDELWISPESAD